MGSQKILLRNPYRISTRDAWAARIGDEVITNQQGAHYHHFISNGRKWMNSCYQILIFGDCIEEYFWKELCFVANTRKDGSPEYRCIFAKIMTMGKT